MVGQLPSGYYQDRMVCGQINHLGVQPITKVNSAFHPYAVCLAGVKAGHVHLCRVAGNTV